MNPDISPFAPVELQSLLRSNGEVSSRVAVVVDPEGKKLEAGVMSRDYKLISNQVISDVAHELLDRTGLPFEEHKILWDGRRFKQQFLIEGMETEVQVGDVVALMLCAQNSYEGSLMAGMSFEMLRVACSNGLCISHVLGSFSLKHWGEKDFENELRVASEHILNVGEYIDRRENVLLVGNSGTGKSHLAMAFALAACAQGRQVRFFPVTQLVTILMERREERSLEKFQQQLERNHLLVLDELGYVPFSKVGAEL